MAKAPTSRAQIRNADAPNSRWPFGRCDLRTQNHATNLLRWFEPPRAVCARCDLIDGETAFIARPPSARVSRTTSSARRTRPNKRTRTRSGARRGRSALARTRCSLPPSALPTPASAASASILSEFLPEDFVHRT
jgi:hypothetical protein